MDAKVAALLVEIHRLIEKSATDAAAAIREQHAEVWYPPNGGLTHHEIAAFTNLRISPELESALRKLIANAAATTIFHTLTCLDGVGEPAQYDGEWFGLALCEPNEDHPNEMLHDQFTETYWAWRESRPDPGWRFDTDTE